MWFVCLSQLKLGWTEAAMVAGARDVDVSPCIVGGFPRKEAALVEVQFIFVISDSYDPLTPVSLMYYTSVLFFLLYHVAVF